MPHLPCKLGMQESCFIGCLKEDKEKRKHVLYHCYHKHSILMFKQFTNNHIYNIYIVHIIVADSPTLDSHAVGNRTRAQSHHLTSIVSPGRVSFLL